MNPQICLVRTLGLVSLVMPYLAATAAAGAPPASYQLNGIVRDFPKTNPDFNVSLATGNGHYVGNLNTALGPGDLPAFTGAGHKVATEWKDSQGRNITPGLFGVSTGACAGPSVGIACQGWIEINQNAEVSGYIQGQTAPGARLTPVALSTNAWAAINWVDVMNSSTVYGNIFVGPDGNTTLGQPTSTVEVSPNSTITGTIQMMTGRFDMPVVNAPAGMPASVGTRTYNGNNGNYTLGTNGLTTKLHCGKLNITQGAKVEVYGHVIILADDVVTISANNRPVSGLIIMAGASLDIYLMQDMSMSAPRVGDINGDASKLRIYSINADNTITVDGNQSRLFAQVFCPLSDTWLEITNGAQFYGSFLGQRFDARNNAKVYVDMALANTASGVNDTAGTTGSASSGGITSAASFGQWYRDVLGENLSAPHTITLYNDGAGVFEYLDDDFHPIDDRLLGNEGQLHNNNFTFAIAADFTHTACADEFLSFSGADDLWVFVNGSLVMDLGGVVATVPQYLELDRLGLSDGQPCKLLLFYAQRQPAAASFRLRTNLILSTPPIASTVTAAGD